MKLEITRQTIEKIEIEIERIDIMTCDDCTELDELNNCCNFYELCLFSKDCIFIRCYECIRSGKEIE